jgi:hypothetical protein
MEYQKAAQIRKKSLISLIAENKFKKEQSLGSSIGTAISEKFKAKATGIKEKFDPLNIISKIVGKGTFGKIATTIAGRALGKSERDISYFGGYGRKRKSLSKKTNIGQIDNGGLSGGSDPRVIGVLSEMYSFMQKTHEKSRIQSELEESIKQEQLDEDEIRHDKLVKAIKSFVKVKKLSDPSKPSEEGGLFGWITNMITKIKDEIMKIIDDIMKIIKPIEEFFKIVGKALLDFGLFFLKNPLILSALAMLIGAYKSGEFLESIEWAKKMAQKEGKLAQKAFKEKQTDFSSLKLTKDEAQAILDQDESPAKKRDIESFGGIERLQAIASGKPDPGGISLQKPVDLKTPTNQTKQFQEKKMEVMQQKVAPRPEGEGTKGVLKQKQWDKNFSENYNNDGSLKTPTQAIPTPVNNEIPKQANPNEQSLTGNNNSVVAIKNNVNNLSGGAPKMFNMDSIKIRDSSLMRHLWNSAVNL